MLILGVNSAYHESAACIVRDGVLVAAAEEERFTRVKHGKRSRIDNADDLPEAAMAWCLQEAGATWADLDHVAWSFDPDERLRRNLGLPDAARMTPGDWGSEAGERAFHAANLRGRDKLVARAPRAAFHFVRHHLCHAASAFLVSPWEEAAVLAVDGIAELASTWLGVGRGPRLECLAEVDYPHSLGFLWEKFSEFLGFDRYSGPGKVMGLSATTDPVGDHVDYLDRLHSAVRFVPMGFELDPGVFRFRTDDFGGMEPLFGPRRPRVVCRYEEASIASALQAVTEEVFVHLANDLHAAAAKALGHPVDTLCLAGGVALNCLANAAILARTPFRRLYVQPAANDAGTCVGAAFHVWNGVLGQPRRHVMDDAFTGPGFTDDGIRRVLDARGVAYARPDDLDREVARRVYDGQIVARFHGRMEFGPRALGNRTLLADPTRFDMREVINTRVKFREGFRPFAPSVLEEAMEHHFECGPRMPADEFMLLVYRTRDREHLHIPAVVQEDECRHFSTSRVQTVNRDRNPAYHRLISEFQALSGVGVVLNTSFNCDEPIDCTPEQALDTLGKTRIDALAIGPYLVSRA